jgi:transcriptional regulator with XRE-family HTH domain
MARKDRVRPPYGQHLTELRKAAGLTQTELASLIEEPQTSIARWEASDRPPRADVALKLSKALHVSIEVVLNSEKKPAKPGPKTKVAQAMERVSMLPARQQEQVLQVVNALLLQFQQPS